MKKHNVNVSHSGDYLIFLHTAASFNNGDVFISRRGSRPEIKYAAVLLYQNPYATAWLINNSLRAYPAEIY